MIKTYFQNLNQLKKQLSDNFSEEIAVSLMQKSITYDNSMGSISFYRSGKTLYLFDIINHLIRSNSLYNEETISSFYLQSIKNIEYEKMIYLEKYDQENFTQRIEDLKLEIDIVLILYPYLISFLEVHNVNTDNISWKVSKDKIKTFEQFCIDFLE